jgi:hypothetical protein
MLSCWNQPYSVSSSVLTPERIAWESPIHIFQVILSLNGVELNGLDVDSVNSTSDYFAYLCIPVSKTKLHQKGMPIAGQFHFGNRLQKPIAKINSGSWIAQLQGMDYCCFTGSGLHRLCCPSCTWL